MKNTIPKLLCVSVNPAIDRRIRVPRLDIGKVNRAQSADPAAGGKAAHVAFAAKALGADVRWLAFLGGPEGASCRDGIEARGVTPVVVDIAGRTRMTLEIIDELTGKITEVLEPGPVVCATERAQIIQVYAAELQEKPVVVLSGSLPGGVESGFYLELVKTAKTAGCCVLLDTSGEGLRQALQGAPDFIKPNREEAGALLGQEIHSIMDAVKAARELGKRGPRTVIMSLGAQGAVVVEEARALHAIAPAVKATSTVGSGDSFLAGWAFAMAQGMVVEECLRLAVACGTANCLAASPGVIALDDVRRLSGAVQIEDVPISAR